MKEKMKKERRPMDDLAFFKLNGKKTVHLVPPASAGGPFSDTAICGVSATVEIPFPRYADVTWQDGSKIFLGHGTIVRKSVDGWFPVPYSIKMVPHICKRCKKSYNKSCSKNTAKCKKA